MTEKPRLILNVQDLAERIEEVLKNEATHLHHSEILEALDKARQRFRSVRGTMYR